MRGLSLAISCVAFLCIGFGLYGQQEGKLSGEIIYGKSKSQFTYFYSSFAGASFPYARTVDDMGSGSMLDLPRIRLASVARVDFLPLTKEEKNTLKEKKLYTVRKAVVKFKDGTSKENVFLYIGQVSWKSQNEEGNLDSESVVALVFQ